ncbi:cysteine protease ATG4, partial [Phenoliferia sp. Uapishka_3]
MKLQAIFSFPQSVGIAGGRPSSSYYFVGAQANSLFYIDPHHPRPCIPLQSPPPDLFAPAQSLPLSSAFPPRGHAISDSFITVVPDSPTTPVQNYYGDQGRLSDFFEEAYSDASLRTYHTEKVRKMALTSLDPSMLVGFLVRDEADWEDFSSRVRVLSQAHKPIFSIADSPPAWMRRSLGSGAQSSTDESDGGAASFSEPDDWELDSANASSPPQRPIELEDGDVELDDDDDEEWEGTSSVLDLQSSEAQTGHDQSWQEVPSTPTATNGHGHLLALSTARGSHSIMEDDGVVVNATSSPIGEAPVLVDSNYATTRTTPFGKSTLDEGWEGVPASSTPESSGSYRLAPSPAASSKSSSSKSSSNARDHEQHDA